MPQADCPSITSLIAEKRALSEAIRSHSYRLVDKVLFDRWLDLDELMLECEPQTPAEAIGALQYALDQYSGWHTDDEVDTASALHKTLLKKSLHILASFYEQLSGVVGPAATN